MSKWLLATTVLLLASCHTMRFEVTSGPISKVVHDRKSFYVGGLFPTRKVDLLFFCPDGVVAIREQTRFVDGLFNFITLGIWTPRSSWYYCAAKRED